MSIQEAIATGLRTDAGRLTRPAVFIVLLAALGVLAFFAHERPFFGWDVTIADWVRGLNITGFGGFMEAVSFTGDRVGIFASIGLTAAVATRFFGWRAGVLVLTVLLVLGLNEQLKELIDRPRPGEVVTLGSKSFPSGHTLHAVLLLGVIWILAGARMAKWSHRLCLGGLFVAWVLLVSLSRIYLERHWPSDVLGAYLLGAAVLWIMAWAAPGLLQGRYVRSSSTPRARSQ